MGVRIQELPETTGIKKEDVLIVEDGQGTKKGTVQQLDEALGVSQLKEDIAKFGTYIYSSNLFNKNDIKRGEYINQNGVIAYSESVATSGKIKIESNKNYYLTPCPFWVAWYDNDTFISTSTQGVKELTSPSNANNCKVIAMIADLDVVMFNKGNVEIPYEPYYEPYFKINENILPDFLDKLIPIEITPSSDIIDLLLKNPGKTFIVKDGTYDIIQIYKNKYGNDYFENKSSITGESIEHYGLPLKKGTKLICSQNAKFLCNYTGTNLNVIRGFSGFACANGYSIDGLNLHATNVKYGIHDDYNEYSDTPYNVEIKNCTIISDHQAIGGGLGKYGTYEIHDNYIEQINGEYDMRYHNNINPSECVMRFYNNYFPNTLRLSYYGASSADSTKCYVSNNYMRKPLMNDKETEDSNVNNMKVIAWNNGTN